MRKPFCLLAAIALLASAACSRADGITATSRGTSTPTRDETPTPPDTTRHEGGGTLGSGG